MKIGIVTVQDSNNFGSFLQAYALEHVLKTMGHEVFFIRTRSKEYIRGLFYQARPHGRQWLRLRGYLRNNYPGWKKYRRFQREQKGFKVIEPEQADGLDLAILGSDEIWNVNTKVFRSPIFYGQGLKKVMAYAVSIGNAEISDMTCIDAAWFQRIKPIFARDWHTADFLRTIQIEAPVVCDPTILVGKSLFYRKFRHSLLDGTPYLLVYTYGMSPEMAEGIRAFAKKKHLRVLSACFSFPWCDGNLDCSALDFCSVLENADYVFTSTYHGTIFSILNHKRFVSFPQSRKTRDLLEHLSLVDRLINERDCNCVTLENIFANQIDYVEVDRILGDWREKSIHLLQEGMKRDGRNVDAEKNTWKNP